MHNASVCLLLTPICISLFLPYLLIASRHSNIHRMAHCYFIYVSYLCWSAVYFAFSRAWLWSQGRLCLFLAFVSYSRSLFRAVRCGLRTSGLFLGGASFQPLFARMWYLFFVPLAVVRFRSGAFSFISKTCDGFKSSPLVDHFSLMCGMTYRSSSHSALFKV